MVPVRLTAKNFLTFLNLEFDFKSGPTLLVGQNLTDDNQVSNGSGKSSIQAAMEFCLFAYTSRKVVDRNLIHFGQESAELSLDIFCPVRKQTLMIDRKINKKGSGECKLYLNQRDKESYIELATVNDCNKFIIDWIGISKEDLSNYYIINKERFRSFFSSSNTQKIELIGRFSRANALDGIDVLIKKDVSKLEEQSREKQESISRLEGKIDGLEEKIETEKSIDFEQKKKDKISAIKERIEKAENDILSNLGVKESKEKTIRDVKKNLIRLNEDLEAISDTLGEKENNPFTSLFQEIKEQKNKVLEEKSKFDKEMEKKRRTENEISCLLEEIRKNLAGTVHCPSCGFEFKVGEDIDIEEEKKRLPEAESLLKLAAKSIDKVAEKISVIDDKLREIKEKESDVEEKNTKFLEERRRIQQEINKIKNQIDQNKNIIEDNNGAIGNISKRIKELTDSILDYKNQIKEVEKEEKDESVLDSYRKSVEGIREEISGIEKENEELQLKIFQKSQWIEQFKEFKFYLANESIKVIQGYCNKSLAEMGSDMQIMIEGYKTLSNGKIKEEITPYIVREEIRDFWSFSGGERARMEYAMIMAIQAMINATNKYGGFHFLSTDEAPSEGLDEEGIKYVIKSLAGYDFPIMITTHVNNVKVDTQTITVRKENGVSNLIYER